MIRVILLRLVLAAVIPALLLGCGGEKGTSPSSKNYILFMNRFVYGSEQTRDQDSRIHVMIEACQQDFWLERDETRRVECVPEDKSTTFTVKIETREFDVTWKVRQGTWSGEVSIGQTVTIMPGTITPNIRVIVEN